MMKFFAVGLWLSLAAVAASAAGGVNLKELEGQEWYGLYLNEAKSGWAMSDLKVNGDGTVTAIDDAHLRVTMGSMRQDMQIYQERTYSADGRLFRIEQRVVDPSGESQFVCTAKGDKMVCEKTMAGVTATEEVPRPSDSVDDLLKQRRLAGPDAKVGDSLGFTFFEPMLQKEIECSSTIVGEEERMFDGALTKVFVIESHISMMNMDTTSYVAEDGTLLEDVTAGFIVMRLEPKDLAMDVKYQNDVIVSNAAMVDEPIEDARGRDSLALELRGPLGDQHLFNDGRQTIAKTGDDTFLFTSQRIDPDGFTHAVIPVDNADVAQWLEPTTYVQSADPALVAKAKEIIGDETDAMKAVEKLSAWVYENVDKRFSARLTNSLEVLQNLEGDCTEHSMLFIGLARAAGIPAREVAGLIYIDQPDPGFYFHQWAKAWVGEWIDVDPTFNQPVADVTHIKLAEGDLVSQAKIIPIIGRISIAMVGEGAPAEN